MNVLRLAGMVGHCDGINQDSTKKGRIAKSLFFECSNYEKTTQEATFTEDVCETLYDLGKEFDIPAQDIRDNISSVDEACALFADRIRKATARDKDQ